jgi:hypothetical protein
MVWWRQAHVIADIVVGAALLFVAVAIWRSRGREDVAPATDRRSSSRS